MNLNGRREAIESGQGKVADDHLKRVKNAGELLDTTMQTAPTHRIIGSYLKFFKNGADQGCAFEDLYEGSHVCRRTLSDFCSGLYFPAVSLYMGARVTLNFGPNFSFPPSATEFKPASDMAPKLPPLPGPAIYEEALLKWEAEEKERLKMEEVPQHSRQMEPQYNEERQATINQQENDMQLKQIPTSTLPEGEAEKQQLGVPGQDITEQDEQRKLENTQHQQNETEQLPATATQSTKQESPKAKDYSEAPLQEQQTAVKEQSGQQLLTEVQPSENEVLQQGQQYSIPGSPKEGRMDRDCTGLIVQDQVENEAVSTSAASNENVPADAGSNESSLKTSLIEQAGLFDTPEKNAGIADSTPSDAHLNERQTLEQPVSDEKLPLKNGIDGEPAFESVSRDENDRKQSHLRREREQDTVAPGCGDLTTKAELGVLAPADCHPMKNTGSLNVFNNQSPKKRTHDELLDFETSVANDDETAEHQP